MNIRERGIRNARETDLRQAIMIGLDEALTALEEAFYDLSDDQLVAFPVPGRNNIAWILMHCLDNLDANAIGVQTGERRFDPAAQWDLWRGSPRPRPYPGASFPSKAELLSLLHQITERVFEILDGVNAEWPAEPLDLPLPKRVRADFYMRTIYHTMSHIRQIWLLRGALGLADDNWPRQYWA